MTEALERHDHITATADVLHSASAAPATPTIDAPAVAGRRAGPAEPPASSSTRHTGGTPRVTAQATPAARAGERRPRRERDIAAFRERRQHAADEARAEARERIARAGELACVADALAALAHPDARPWDAEREQLERALETGRIVEVGAGARRALWAISARRGAQLAPGQARPGSRAGRVRRLRDHRPRATQRAQKRAAHPSHPPRRGPSPAARSGADTTSVTARAGGKRGSHATPPATHTHNQ